MIRVKRVYEPAEATDGYRVLVDRLWPRGLRKEAARVDLWLKEIAPSNELRKWYHHDPAQWEEFQQRYGAELRDHEDLVALLRTKAREGDLTLLFSSREAVRNNAAALKAYLEKKTPSR